MLRHAVLHLRLSPDAFWRLSLREWRLLTEAGGDAGLTRPDLNTLMTLYPDTAP
ncbi:MAG: phage tail assembly chaperone [Caulobacteraceae bacterium]